MKLKHEVFCHEFICSLTGKESAIKSGYKISSAKYTACRLLKRQDVRQKIKEIAENIHMAKVNLLMEKIKNDIYEAEQEQLNLKINPSKNSKYKTIQFNTPGQLSMILQEGNLSNKELHQKTGKDRGYLSRLLRAKNMNVNTFLELCNCMDLEIYVRCKKSYDY